MFIWHLPQAFELSFHISHICCVDAIALAWWNLSTLELTACTCTSLQDVTLDVLIRNRPANEEQHPLDTSPKTGRKPLLNFIKDYQICFLPHSFSFCHFFTFLHSGWCSRQKYHKLGAGLAVFQAEIYLRSTRHFMTKPFYARFPDLATHDCKLFRAGALSSRQSWHIIGSYASNFQSKGFGLFT